MVAATTEAPTLSGHALRELIRSGRLGVAPLLEWGGERSGPGQFGPGSLDLRLGTYFRVPRDLGIGVIDPVGREGKTGEEGQDLFPLVRCRYGHPFVLHPGRFALAYTLEFISMPKSHMAYVVGRSSWGRLGLIIATATMINPGFRGVITLELANVGTVPVTLYPAMRIAQLVVHFVPVPEVSTTSDGSLAQSGGKYIGQLPGNSQLLYRDRDIPWVAPPRASQIIGLVGPTCSGKSRLTSLLIERGYRHFSLAEPLRRIARTRGLSLSTPALQDLGDELRKRSGRDFLAREVLRSIRTTLNESSRVVVTGFKNPAELEFFMRNDRFAVVGVSASEHDCASFFFKEKGLELDQVSPTDRSEFTATWNRDYSSDSAEGQNVGQCLIKVPPDYMIKNSPQVSQRALREAVEALVRKIETER